MSLPDRSGCDAPLDMMKAVTRYRYGGPEQLQLESVAQPHPGRREVLVQVLACGLNLSDWEGLKGRPLYARIGGLRRPRLPVLGSDIVGEVIACGTEVTEWRVGQKVWAEVVSYGMGGLAEKALLPAHRLAPLPNGLDPVVAAALPQSGAIALAATKGLSDGQRLLVNGAGGGSGSLILQLARRLDVHITGVDTVGKAAFMLRQGAHQTLDYRTVDFTQINQKWDRIIDLVATRPAWRVRRVLSDNGRYIVFGGKMASVLSALITTKSRIGTAEGTPDILGELGALTMRRHLSPAVAEEIPLCEAASGLARVGAGDVAGKLVIVPRAVDPGHPPT